MIRPAAGALLLAALLALAGCERAMHDMYQQPKDGPGARITHVGFVTGPDTMLHAPDSGERRYVVEEELPPERRPTLVAAGRF